MPRERLIATAQRVYRSYGFSPIDTPALEYEEILLGKGGGETDKQLYRFEDPGGRRVALRFDLTVPLARFVAQHYNELGMPFKRYHIGTVWRGENTQRGRYREFMQCDFDTIGTLSPAADIENGAGDPRSVAGDRLRGVHDPRQQPDGALPVARAARAGRTFGRPFFGPSTSCGRSAASAWPRKCQAHGRGNRRAGPRGAAAWPICRAPTSKCSVSSSRSWPAAKQGRPASPGWPSCSRRPRRRALPKRGCGST